MAEFMLYAGMGGGFGGIHPVQVVDVPTITDAEEWAYQLAVEDYQSYEGSHGILSYDECVEEVEDLHGEDNFTDSDVEDYYREEIESWIVYEARPISEVNEDDLREVGYIQ